VASVFNEVFEHANWVINNLLNVNLFRPDPFLAASAGLGYNQNLFLDGYIKWSIQQRTPDFRKYLINCLV
jgi:hypothetical protein